MAEVLLVGEDDLLLRTRAAILRGAAARVLCSSPASVLEAQADCNCDVVVICHSLSSQLCAEMIHVFRERWPATRILLLLPHWTSPRSEYPEREADAVCLAEPKHLTVCVTQLLTSPAHQPASELDGPANAAFAQTPRV